MKFVSFVRKVRCISLVCSRQGEVLTTSFAVAKAILLGHSAVDLIKKKPAQFLNLSFCAANERNKFKYSHNHRMLMKKSENMPS